MTILHFNQLLSAGTRRRRVARRGPANPQDVLGSQAVSETGLLQGALEVSHVRR
jgi:hypothetical protein